MTTKLDTVVLLDFGAQYGQLIARRIREANVFCEVLPHDASVEEIKKHNPKALVLSGGPASVYSENAPTCDPEVFNLDIPVFGICYGLQIMTYLLGGDVRKSERREYGKTMMTVHDNSDLFKDLGKEMQVWMSHGDFVVKPPEGFTIIASTENSPVAAMANKERKLYGVQFHPEVMHTPKGNEVINNFLREVALLKPEWTMDSFIESSIMAIKQQVKEGRAVAGLSGGVDSSVAVALVHKAIGDRLQAIFVDHGLLRQGEVEEVRDTFLKLGVNLRVVDAKERFLKRLEGVSDPEAKRKLIGEEFIRVFEEEAIKVSEESKEPVKFLVQGTVYPDVIESGAGSASVIKSHHNVGGLPEDMEFELVEPLRYLFKDEVRKVGEELGLPASIIKRQPFPGPGLAIRILGDVTEDRLNILRQADAIITEEMKTTGLYDELWQSFAVLSTMKSVGVMGDERTYAYTLIFRAVTSEDGMTADWAKIPYETLEAISSKIINQVDGVNRVVYDITSKPPGTIEWE